MTVLRIQIAVETFAENISMGTANLKLLVRKFGVNTSSEQQDIALLIFSTIEVENQVTVYHQQFTQVATIIPQV